MRWTGISVTEDECTLCARTSARATRHLGSIGRCMLTVPLTTADRSEESKNRPDGHVESQLRDRSHHRGTRLSRLWLVNDVALGERVQHFDARADGDRPRQPKPALPRPRERPPGFGGPSAVLAVVALAAEASVTSAQAHGKPH